MLAPLGRETPSAALIYKIVYRSFVVDISDVMQRERDVADILSKSLPWNSSQGITGALLLSRTGYAQVLEGPPHAVKSLFGHIACDRRHQSLELLFADYDSKRDFGNWSMAVVGPPDDGDVELASMAYSRNLVLGDRADDIRMMLHWLLTDGPLRDRRH